MSAQSSTLELVLRRDRAIIVAALALLAALAWAYLLSFGSADDHAPDAVMAGMVMGKQESAPFGASWTPVQFVIMCAMWLVMMVGMMTPAVAPMALIYARVGRTTTSAPPVIAPTLWFIVGYFLIWGLFSLAATGAQWGLDMAAVLTLTMKLAAPKLGGAFLIGAGIYEVSPFKQACLGNCRSPVQFIVRHGGFKLSSRHSIRLGLLHGVYCLGCCWALMLLLFVGGVMNPIWIAGLAALVLLEQVAPAGPWIARLAGGAMIAVGILLISGLWPP